MKLKTFLNKKLLIKLIIIISLIGLTALSFVLINNYSKNNSSNEMVNYDSSNEEIDEELISIRMSLIDKNNNVIFDETRYDKDKECLYDVLIKYHNVKSFDSIYGKVVLEIDTVKTKFYTESYIAIYINDSYSNFGISNIYVYEGIKVTFKEVAL